MRKALVLFSVFIFSMFVVGSVSFSQDNRRKPPDTSKSGQRAEPRKQQPPPRSNTPPSRGSATAEPRRQPPDSGRGQRAEPRRAPDPPQRGRVTEPSRQLPPPNRGRATTPRRGNPPPTCRAETRPRNNPEWYGHAVPRTRPLPLPHPKFGSYYRLYYGGNYYFWRHYPHVYRYGSRMCIHGYWEWDSWCECWVWVEGYCSIPGHFRYHSFGFFFWFVSEF